MSKSQDDKKASYKATNQFLGDNDAIVSTLPQLPAQKVTLGLKIDTLEKLEKKKLKNTTGISADKTIIKIKAADSGFELSKMLTALARDKKDYVLLKAVIYSQSSLRRLRDSKLGPTIQGLLDLAKDNAEALVAYGATTEFIASVGKALADFAAVEVKPKMSQAEMKELNRQINALYAEIDALLVEMDAQVALVEKSHPEFFHTYHTLRHVVHTGVVKVALELLVKSASTGEGLPQAEVLIELQYEGTDIPEGGSKFIHYVKKTSAHGKLPVKGMPHAQYKITAFYPGCAKKSVLIVIVEGKLNHVVIELENNK